MRNFIPILCLSVVLSSMGHPASSSAEGTGFCLPVDSERLDRHLQRAAAKPALLNAGAPRTVRMIYFVSDPQAFRQEVVEQMKTTIREVQRILPTRSGRTDSEREPSVLRGMHKMNPWFISYMVPEVLTTIGVPLDVFNRTSISRRTFTSSSLAPRKTFNCGMSWGWDCNTPEPVDGRC